MQLRFGATGDNKLSAITCAPLLASRLWGAVESLREEIASPQSPPAREKQMGQVTAARAMLNDPTAFDAAWTEGRTLPLAQAIALAQEYSLTNATR